MQHFKNNKYLLNHIWNLIISLPYYVLIEVIIVTMDFKLGEP